MRGLWIESGELHLREDLPEPRQQPGEVRVRVCTTGICATDLALWRGYMDFKGVPGHEFVGIALDGPLAGKRVVGEINSACGQCATCRAGRSNHCPNRDVLGILGRPGAFAEMLSLPQSNLHAVPAGLSNAAAAFAEPAAAALRIVEQLGPQDGLTALVLGDGRLGILCAQALAAGGAIVDLAGRHPERGSWLDAKIRHRGLPADLKADPAWDLVVEASGDPNLLESALGWVRPCGTLVLKTTAERPASLDLAPLVVNEIRLLGSRCGPFDQALLALSDGRMQVEPMIAARFPLEEAERAFERAAAGGVLKILVDQEDQQASQSR